MPEQRATRSPHLMSAGDTALLVVDVQQKLINLISDHQRIVWNIQRLVLAAKALDVPILATEQYPKGLGGTVKELAQLIGEAHDKVEFSCLGCEALVSQIEQLRLTKLLVSGIEAHVCIQQTVMDLLGEGMSVYVAADAVGSRGKMDYEIALRRMDSAGATITTTEAAMFELCEKAGTDQFKKISALVRQSPPA